jgi:uncharacterized membrane protein YoaK (UPF0700 family)
MRSSSIAALLSLNGGFVDTIGFLGLQGLFTAHVTGNFVTLAAALVLGTHGVIAKLLALPEFVAVIVVARLLSMALTARGMPALRYLLVAKVAFLLAFFVLAVSLGPFPNSDVPVALLTGFTGIAGMAVQNAVQRVHFGTLPPTTLMTGNTTQATLDAVDLLFGGGGGAGDAGRGDQAAAVRTRFGRTVRSIAWFALGCALAAVLFYWTGFWSLAAPVVVGAAVAILGQD